MLVPASNVQHLMLRADVVQAVKEGTFQVYPVSTVSEGIELLTGTSAGVAPATADNGPVPDPTTVYGRIFRRLETWVERAGASATSAALG